MSEKNQSERVGHTPGPWHYSPDGTARFTICGDGWRLAKLDDNSGENVEANARLIAAAPELLDTLKTIANYDCYYFGDKRRPKPCGCPSCIARAAIVKAEAK